MTADESRKNCQINLDISYSAGYSYSVYSADYSGYADIDSGVQGTVAANYYFSGEQDQVGSSFHVSSSTPFSLPLRGSEQG